MKILIILLIITVAIIALVHYNSSNKNWFNKNGEYSDFPFAFKIYNKNGYEIVREDPANENMSIVAIKLKEFSPSIPESLPEISVSRNISLPEAVYNHETVKDIILDSQTFKIADLGSGRFIYVIAIHLESEVGYFTIEINGSNKESVDEVINLIQESFRFREFNDLALTVRDLGEIKATAIAYFETSDHDFKNAFVQELVRGNIVMGDQVSIGVWNLEVNDNGYSLIRYGAFNPSTNATFNFFLNLKKENNKWVALDDSYEFVSVEP